MQQEAKVPCGEGFRRAWPGGDRGAHQLTLPPLTGWEKS